MKGGGLDNPSNEPSSDDVQYDKEEEDHGQSNEDFVGDISSPQFRY